MLAALSYNPAKMTMPRRPNDPVHFYSPRNWTLAQRLGHYTDESCSAIFYQDTRCWEWRGKRNPQGYGTYTHNDKTQGAHRWAYLEFVGEIPTGLFVCHRCDNPACVRPSHLFLGTASDNTCDRDEKGRGLPSIKKGSANGASKLTEAEVAAVYVSMTSGNKLAKEYGVTQALISLIKTGRKWGWLTKDLQIGS